LLLAGLALLLLALLLLEAGLALLLLEALLSMLLGGPTLVTELLCLLAVIWLVCVSPFRPLLLGCLSSDLCKPTRLLALV